MMKYKSRSRPQAKLLRLLYLWKLGFIYGIIGYENNSDT